MEFAKSLIEELSIWSSQGRKARFWWRDDDAVSHTPQLDQLLELAERFGIGIALAVIPAKADRSLQLRLQHSRCSIWQHGWDHTFHEDGEFGTSRPAQSMMQDALMGQRALDELFGTTGWQRVFVPPNHALSMAFKARVHDLDYLGVSAGDPLTPRIKNVRELNAENDLMDWPKGALLPLTEICDRLSQQLRAQRTEPAAHADPIGILTHHLAFNESAWHEVASLIELLCEQNAIEWVAPLDLFEPRHATRDQSELSPKESDVTVVVTSCGRPDLLQKTLDSFLAYNTYPVREILVMEDGPTISSLGESPAYRGRVRWLCTGVRLGQMPSIDRAYEHVRTSFIFHCEDDWEFFAGGFIEKSRVLLTAHPRLLQVWLRALNDTNGHPIAPEVSSTEGISYHQMQTHFDAGEWGIWHGFSLNPGLRRRRDCLLLGSFAAFQDPAATKSFEVERRASVFYERMGFVAAILADNDGQGYVRHIGWGRHVGEPDANTPQPATADGT